MTRVAKDAVTSVLGRRVKFGCNGHKVTEGDAVRLDMSDRGTDGPAHSSSWPQRSYEARYMSQQPV